jgi:hypothetical protein
MYHNSAGDWLKSSEVIQDNERIVCPIGRGKVLY